ncbi:helix-turn-helix transcriptional regulator [Vibrio sp. 10N.222.52.C3]|uniref:helix-turn-helix transcriptional regulator n=1 Tax=Vibrio sp. 10N.222.52.C3 TaxID=3229631 RepID=UPI00354D0750
MGASMSKSSRSNKETVYETVARLRASREQPKSIASHQPTHSGKSKLQPNTQAKQKVSKNSKAIRASDRKTAMDDIIKQLLLGGLTQGQALRTLRVNILGLKQDVFAKLVDVSRKTLSDIENDRGSYNTEVLNKVFKPFGMKTGLIPSSPSLLISLLNSNETE